MIINQIEKLKKGKKIEEKDVLGNLGFKLVSGESEPLSNICTFCGKCAECEHPFWGCPKFTELKNKYV